MTNKNNRKSDPTIIVLFGGTGDLSRRKVVPALYNLFLDQWLPENFAIIASSIHRLTDEEYREEILPAVNQFSRRGKVRNEHWNTFADHLFYLSADINVISDYKAIRKAIENHKNSWDSTSSIIYYCAVAPHFFGTIAENIGKSQLENNLETTRIIVEKPFGRDLESARALNRELLSFFDETQIYRIDHYLGKEVVQNIMALRFANEIMEPLWNRNHVEQVQISVTEQIGIGTRGDYFDHAGILRDMIQNHLMQLVSIIAMEPPIDFTADEVRNRKIDVLKAIRKIEPVDIDEIAVRGQYDPGWIGGKKVIAYREEKNVDPDSNTETYAALKLNIDNMRWQGVPFYLRTGKRLCKTATVVTLQFHRIPHKIFRNGGSGTPDQNRLVISIQPDMAILFQMQNKIPGLEMNLNTVDVIFDYHGNEKSDTPEAYETLLLDVMDGDQTLFMRADQVEAAWELIMPILNRWDKNKSTKMTRYAAGTWGPEKAEGLIAQDGYYWFDLPEIN